MSSTSETNGPNHVSDAVSQDVGYKHVIDNINIRKDVADTTEEHQNINENWVSHMVVKNRVRGNELPAHAPICSIISMENGKDVPNPTDPQMQYENHMNLVRRIIQEFKEKIQC